MMLTYKLKSYTLTFIICLVYIALLVFALREFFYLYDAEKKCFFTLSYDCFVKEGYSIAKFNVESDDGSSYELKNYTQEFPLNCNECCNELNPIIDLEKKKNYVAFCIIDKKTETLVSYTSSSPLYAAVIASTAALSMVYWFFCGFFICLLTIRWENQQKALQREVDDEEKERTYGHRHYKGECYICTEPTEGKLSYKNFCNCKNLFVHSSCHKRWQRESGTNQCAICGVEYKK